MKKNIILISVLVIIFIIIGIFIFKTKYQEECMPFSGGSFNIIFETNGGKSIPNMDVCIACSPDSYEDLPIPERDGYIFEGWYYDKKLTMEVKFTNSKDFQPIPEYNIYKCMTGYKDKKIYAKWNSVN